MIEAARTLAQNTQKSTVEIESMIQTLESKVFDAIGSMNGGTELAENVVSKTHEVTKMLNDVQHSVNRISDSLLQIIYTFTRVKRK